MLHLVHCFEDHVYLGRSHSGSVLGAAELTLTVGTVSFYVTMLPDY